MKTFFKLHMSIILVINCFSFSSFAYDLLTIMPRYHLAQADEDFETSFAHVDIDGNPIGTLDVDFDQSNGFGLALAYKNHVLQIDKFNHTGAYITQEAGRFQDFSLDRFNLQWNYSGHWILNPEPTDGRMLFNFFSMYPGLFYNYVEYPGVIISWDEGQINNPNSVIRFEQFIDTAYDLFGLALNWNLQFQSEEGYYCQVVTTTKYGWMSLRNPDNYKSDSTSSYYALAVSTTLGYEKELTGWSIGVFFGYQWFWDGSPDYNGHQKTENGRDFELQSKRIQADGFFGGGILRF